MASSSAGYTLVEVVVAVVLVGILAAIVVPRFSGHFLRIALTSDLSILDATVSQALQLSKTQRNTVEIGLIKNADGEITGYQLGQNLNLDGSTPNATIFKTETFSAGTIGSATEGVRRIRFSPTGIASLTATNEAVTTSVIAIQLSSPEGVTGQIQLDRSTETRVIQAPTGREP